MANPAKSLPLESSSIPEAYEKIRTYVHRTPLLTNKTLDKLASTSRDGQPAPKFNLFFKCENYQRIGAFKARGAFHAVTRLIEEMGIEEVRRRGVVTHSSGNHAQALALAASTFQIPAHIVMPTISTPSKIAGTQSYTDTVYFSGSTSQEREEVVRQVIRDTGAILVPPYDHPDIMLGQGTAAFEMDEQYHKLQSAGESRTSTSQGSDGSEKGLRVVITPLGGGGLLSGTTIYFSDKPDTYVFGAEPSYQGGNDAQIGLSSNPPKRIETVKTLTIADGLRTPLGEIPWKIFTSGSEVKPKFLEGVHSVTEEQIKETMKLVLERMKVFVEPSAVVGLAVILHDPDFRRWAYEKQKAEGGGAWDVGVVFSGGNTTIEAIVGLFGGKEGKEEKRAESKVGSDGTAIAENVAG